MLTYKQAYDLLIDSYYKDEIKPYDPKFCFCGTLNENNEAWISNNPVCRTHNDGINYNGVELWNMEHALLSTIQHNLRTCHKYSELRDEGLFQYSNVRNDLEYEDVLFKGFCKALDVLKQIHIERGEVIDEVCELSKRVLVK